MQLPFNTKFFDKISFSIYFPARKYTKILLVHTQTSDDWNCSRLKSHGESVGIKVYAESKHTLLCTFLS